MFLQIRLSLMLVCTVKTNSDVYNNVAWNEIPKDFGTCVVRCLTCSFNRGSGVRYGILFHKTGSGLKYLPLRKFPEFKRSIVYTFCGSYFYFFLHQVNGELLAFSTEQHTLQKKDGFGQQIVK